MNKYNFKVGDKVHIRAWDDMAAEFGYCDECKDDIACDTEYPFTEEMTPSCGCTATITRIGVGGEVELLFDDEEIEADYGKGWYVYVFNMIEPV